MRKVAKVAISLLAGAALLPLAACSSEGTNRVASVGALPGGDSGTGTGTSSSGGDSGTGSGSGNGTGSGTSGTGSGGGSGTGNGTGTGAGNGTGTGTGTGTTGSGTGTGTGAITGQSLSNLSVPGLVGDGGVAGTGLLANTGNPNNPGALGPVLVTAGNAVLGVTGQTPTLVSAVDSTVPGSVPIAGTIQKVLTDTGQALVDTGTGKAYLVDGLTGAVGDAVALNVLGKNALPGNGGTLVGLSVASPTQNAGTLATVGVDAAGNLLKATVTPLGASSAAVVNAVLPNGTSGSALTNVTGALGNVAAVTAGTTNVLGGGAGTTPAVGVSVLSPTQNVGTLATAGVGSAGQTLAVAVAPVSAVTGTANNAVSATAAQVGSAVTPVTSTVSSVTSALPANGLATVSVGNTTVLSGGANAAVGASVLSPTQATGSALTAGVVSAGNVATAALKGTTSALGGTTTTTTTTSSTPVKSLLGKVL